MIGAWETHEVKLAQKPIREEILHKHYHNSSGDYDIAYINRTTKINVNGILIEYEGEDSGIGLLFASKAAVQVGHYMMCMDGIDRSQGPMLVGGAVCKSGVGVN